MEIGFAERRRRFAAANLHRGAQLMFHVKRRSRQKRLLTVRCGRTLDIFKPERVPTIVFKGFR